MVVSELRGERIDIIPYNDDPARFVAKALSPARVREVIVDDEERSATIIVPDDQLSLAIGKEGQNARLASKLTGWRIDIKSQQQMAEAESSMAFGDDEGVDGQCMAVMRTGKRCPNQAEPGSRYCSIHADYVEPEPVAEAEPAATDEAVPPAEAKAPDDAAAEADEE
jgi:N utilization substance protein A